ncbi:MAG: hypothetical protein ACJAUP_002895 [Cellvibrionaceae bacterium]
MVVCRIFILVKARVKLLMVSRNLVSASGDILITDNDYDKVASLLGRSPRGLRSIPVRSLSGEPVVIQVSSLVDNKPFPTLFWLVDRQLSYVIDQVEAGGLIAEFQAKIDESEELQQAMAGDHKAHIGLRCELMSLEEKQSIEKLGFETVFNRRGIGGIENFTRIRCLHTYYASHLVSPNAVGKLLDSYWLENDISFVHLPASTC